MRWPKSCSPRCHEDRPGSAHTVLACGSLGCSQAFRFTEDAGFDAGTPDAGKDGGTDSGIDAGNDAGFDGGFDAGADGGCNSPGECECEDAGDCAGIRPVCAADHRCVECLANTDCGANGLCDPKTRRCTTACAGAVDCDGGVRYRCENDVPRHCVACDDLVGCGGVLPPICAESVGIKVSDSPWKRSSGRGKRNRREKKTAKADDEDGPLFDDADAQDTEDVDA